MAYKRKTSTNKEESVNNKGSANIEGSLSKGKSVNKTIREMSAENADFSTSSVSSVSPASSITPLSSTSFSSTTTPLFSPNTPATTAELREWYNSYEKQQKKNYEREIEAQKERKKENYAAADNVLKSLRDVTKNSTRTVTAFSKESLRSYLQNIGSNERNLRNLSRYLYYRCHAYYRLVMYNANMFCLDARSVIPSFSLVKENDPDEVLRSYQETLEILNKMNLQFEFLKMYVINFREDVAYGCAYYDDMGLFILPLDSDYCRISGVYTTGDFAFSMDMTYFRSRQELLELWGEPFTSMYRAYESSQNRWQPMPDEYAVCLKARAEDWETILPVFSGLLAGIINLIDLDDLQAISDEQDIFKMIWLEMETLTNANAADEWKVDPDIMVKYFNRMINEALPDYTSAAIIPGKLNSINFNNDKASDTNKIAKSTETLFNSSGGAQILNSSTISGTTAFTAAIQADTEMAISMLLPQTQGWVNRFLHTHISNPAQVKFFEISVYTKQAFKKEMLESAQYGLPTKLAYNSLNGFNELETLALNYLEEDVLNLSAKFKPLQNSFTQTGGGNGENGTSGEIGQGAPVKDIGERTDDGEASIDKRDRA